MHPLFAEWPMPALSPNEFDSALEKHPGEIVVVFFWGHNCPNCDVAKRMIHQEIETYKQFPLNWYHVNTYDHAELGTRFGLHGIPTFLFFKNSKILGRATSFPGHDEFLRVLQTVCEKHR